MFTTFTLFLMTDKGTSPAAKYRSLMMKQPRVDGARGRERMGKDVDVMKLV